MFVSSKEDAGQIPEIAYLRDTFSSFAYDYLDDFMEENVTTSFTLHRTFAKDIILNSDLFIRIIFILMANILLTMK